MIIPTFPYPLREFRPGIISLQDYLALPDCYSFIQIQTFSSFEKAFQLIESDFDDRLYDYKEQQGIKEDPQFEVLEHFSNEIDNYRHLVFTIPLVKSPYKGYMMHLLQQVIGFTSRDLYDDDFRKNIIEEYDIKTFESWVDEEAVYVITLEMGYRNIIASPIKKLNELSKLCCSFNIEERDLIEQHCIKRGPKFVDLIERFFSSHNDCIDFFVNSGGRMVASDDGRSLAKLERNSPSKWTYTLQWEDGKYVGDYVKPFKPTYENFIQFNIGSKLLADQLRYYIWKMDPALVLRSNPNAFGSLTFKE